MITLSATKRITWIAMLLILSASVFAIPPPLGQISLFPGGVVVSHSGKFFTSLLLEPFSDTLVSYQFTFTYDPAVITVDTATGTNGVVPGNGGFISTVSVDVPGRVTVTGRNPAGLPPASYPDFLTLYWQTVNPGNSDLSISIGSMVNTEGQSVSGFNYNPGHVIVLEPLLGDVNNSRQIDIVDALLVASYYVGLNPPINTLAADVNPDGEINIVDALLIAQYYVGLFTAFPAGTPQIMQVLDLRFSNQSADPILSLRHYGEVTIDPPGVTLTAEDFLLLEQGTTVNLETPLSFTVTDASLTYLLEFQAWSGDIAGSPAADNLLQLVLDTDKKVRISYQLTVQ